MELSTTPLQQSDYFRNYKRCQAISVGHLRATCGNKLELDGVNNSGFCEACWYPSIEADYAIYRDLRKQGVGRDEAASIADLPFNEKADTSKRIVTVTKPPVSEYFEKKVALAKQPETHIHVKVLEDEPPVKEGEELDDIVEVKADKPKRQQPSRIFTNTFTGNKEEILLTVKDFINRKYYAITLITHPDGTMFLHRQESPSFDKHVRRAERLLLARKLRLVKPYETKPDGVYMRVRVVDEVIDQFTLADAISKHLK